MTNKILIMKTGNTVQSLLDKGLDFEDWIIKATNQDSKRFITVAVDRFQPLPSLLETSAIIITGSPAFVTDNAPWNETAAIYLRQAVSVNIPVLGICYGHQLLAQVFGGVIGFHQGGREIGTVEIKTTVPAMQDPLFGELGLSFKAQVSHLQTVLILPPMAQLLAYNDFEPHHGFRLGEYCWGVQFHPEFSADVMKAYIKQRFDSIAGEGLNPDKLLTQVSDCGPAKALLQRFAAIVMELQQPSLSQAN